MTKQKTEEPKTVLMVFPHPVLLTVTNGDRRRFEPGVQAVPQELVDHPYLKANGVVKFDPAAEVTNGSAKQKVARAQADLDRAKSELAAHEHEQAVAAWKQVDRELRKAKHDFEATSRHLQALADTAMILDRERAVAVAALEEHRARKPDDFEDSLGQWMERDCELEEQVKAVVARYSAVVTEREQVRLGAVKLGTAVEQLTFSEHNAREKARGETVAGGWQGNVGAV